MLGAATRDLVAKSQSMDVLSLLSAGQELHRQAILARDSWMHIGTI